MSAAGASPAAQLRALLAKNNLAAVIVPTADAHQSEYVSDADKRRAYLTGFTGSAGTAVVLAEPFTGREGVDESHGPADVTGRLFTDGRYFLQAVAQLDAKEFALMKSGVDGVPKLEEFLLAVLPAGSRVAVDPQITSVAALKALKDAFKGALSVVFLEKNFVDEVWGAARPAYSDAPLMLVPEAHSGESSASKVQRVRQKMVQNKAALLLASALDEVAWLFNLRGGDIPFNPVFRSYALIAQDSCTLYVDPAKVTDEVRKHLGDQVRVRPYDTLLADLRVHAEHSRLGSGARLWLDPAKCSAAVSSLFAAQPEALLEADNPIQLIKSIKNPVELEGMRHAHVKDAAAVCNFFSWLEEQLLAGKRGDLTECSVADKLEQFRAEQPEFVGLSFETIAGAGPNGAIIHYRSEEATTRAVTAEEMFLLDSVAQFRTGTTDITRTVHFGKPSQHERECFTRVLQGHIALAQAVFPQGTTGPTLDAFARQYLWSNGLDYAHGTGHGVGHFLNVHEGPCGISSTARSHTVLTTALQPGMVLSNEPGYYEDGRFGIRIESLIVVAQRQTAHRFQNKQFLGFDTITLVPIQRGLIELSLLSDAQLAWLNEYHRDCREKVAPLLQGKAKEWIMRETESIARQ